MNTRTTQGRLLGLAGKAGCGKSTIAQVLVDRGLAQRVRFAGPLKDGLVAMGLAREQVDGGLKETPSHLLCGSTPRHAMQTLGTEWGRKMIGDNVWVRLAMQRVDALLAAGVNVVLDDVRFDNEAHAILERGGQLITLTRGGEQATGAWSPVYKFPPRSFPLNLLDAIKARLNSHVSDRAVHASEAGLTIATCIIANEGSLDETVEDVLAWWAL